MYANSAQQRYFVQDLLKKNAVQFWHMLSCIRLFSRISSRRFHTLWSGISLFSNKNHKSFVLELILQRRHEPVEAFSIGTYASNLVYPAGILKYDTMCGELKESKCLRPTYRHTILCTPKWNLDFVYFVCYFHSFGFTKYAITKKPVHYISEALDG